MPAARVVVVMGVAGAGKTTVGAGLARRLGVAYAEGDEFHSAANVAKMAAGTALTDADRGPWLASLAGWIAGHSGGVVTCSALKRRYRDVLRVGGDVWFVHLVGAPELLADRLLRRRDHFMPAALLASQLADLQPLEPDEAGITVRADASPADIVERAVAALRGGAD